jgi:uncharacterized repeat protein (TIGR01451 family)
VRARRVALCLVAVLCLASPASAQFATSDLAGVWSAHGLKTVANASMSAGWLQGFVRFDVTGAVTAGTLADPRDELVPLAPGRLVVSVDGRVEGTIGGAQVQARLLPGKHHLVGIATGDVSTYFILTRGPATTPFAQADVTGSWRLNRLLVPELPALAPEHARGDLTFAADGGVVAGAVTSSRGVTTSVVTGQLLLAADGTLSGNLVLGPSDTAEASAFRGVMDPSRRFMVGISTRVVPTGPDAEDVHFGLFTLDRTPTGSYAAADADGRWELFSVQALDAQGGVGQALRGTVVADSQGNVTGGTLVGPDQEPDNLLGGSIDVQSDGAVLAQIVTPQRSLVVHGTMLPSRDQIFAVNDLFTAGAALGILSLVKAAPPPPSTVQFRSATARVAEGGTARIMVDRGGATTTLVSVAYRVNGGDAAGQTGVLTFLPGETSRPFTLTIPQDRLRTGDQTMTVGLFDPTGGATLGARATATVTVGDDEAVVQLERTEYTVTEGTATATITAVRTGSTATAFSVGYSVTPGTAIPDGDFTPVTGTLSFPAGTVRRTFTVPILNDTLVDGDRTVLVTLGAPVGNAVLGSPASAVLTVRDNDQPGVFRLDRSSYVVGEAARSVVVVVQRLGRNLGQDVAVDFATADGTATDGVDYIGQAATLTFKAGEASKRVTIALRRDALVEPLGTVAAAAGRPPRAETFTVSLSNPTTGATLGTPAAATVTIRDDDVAGRLAFTRTSVAVAEGAGAVTLTVTRTGGSAADVLVDWVTVDGSARGGRDYEARSGTLTFGEGVRSATIVVPITEDTEAEGGETFGVELRDPRGGATLASPSITTVTIVDDESAFFFSAPVFTVKEGARTAVITVHRSGPLGTPATVTYAATGLTAVAGWDFTPVSGTLTFPVGVASRTFTVPIRNNSVVDQFARPPAPDAPLDLPPRSIHLALSAPTGGVQLGSQATATLSIVEDDQGGTVSLETSAYTVAESGQLVVLVRRTGARLAGEVSVQLATADGTATAGSDYAGRAETLVFGSGESAKTVTIPIIADTIVEGSETFTVSLSEPTGGAVLGATSSATVTIRDDDVGGVAAFAAPVYRVAEGAGTVSIVVVRSGGRASEAAVDYTTVAGTAQAGDDYGALSGTLTFAANQATATLVIPISQDELLEGAESFTVVLSNARGGLRLGSPAQTVVVIRDDESVVQFSGRVVGNAPEVVRIGALDRRVTVDYVVSNGSAWGGMDLRPVLGTLVFNPGVASRLIPLTIVDDGVAEGPETFWVQLGNALPTGAARLGSDVNRMFTITDNDFGGTVEFGAATYAGAEGQSVTITVLRRGGTGSQLTVSWAAADGTATAGEDFTPASGSLTFGPRDTSKTFTVALVRDRLAEAPESIPLTLSVVPGSATLGTRATTELQIADAPAPQFETAQLTAGLGETKEITILRGGGLGRTFSVQWTTVGGTAVPGQHFTPASGTITFGPDDTSRSFALGLAGDTGGQPDRTLVLGLKVTSGQAGVGAVGTTTLTIFGSASTVDLPLPVYSVTEGSGPAVVTVFRSGNLNRQVTVDYTTTDATAVAGRDYAATSGTVTLPIGQQAATFTVPILANGPSGGSRTFQVALGNPSPNTVIGEAATARVDINEGPVYAFDLVADSTGAIEGFDGAPSLNDGATVAFKARLGDGSQRILTGSGGPLTTIASTSPQGLVDFPGTRFPIDAAGNVAFRATPSAGGRTIFRGAGGPLTALARTGDEYLDLFDPATSPNGTLAFAARPAAGGMAILTGTTAATLRVVQSTGAGSFVGLGMRPAANDAGWVAFAGSTAVGGDGVFVVDPDGDVAPLATVADMTASDRLSIDEWGQVAFLGEVPAVGGGVLLGRRGAPVRVLASAADGFAGFGNDGGDQSPDIHAMAGPGFLGRRADSAVILRGPDPITDGVVRVGDPLLGSNVAALHFGGINGAGQIAFRAWLADGRDVVALATPAGGEADLAVAQTVDRATPLAGTPVTFTITVTNNGPSPATGVQVTDRLPSGYGVVSATPSKGSYDVGSGVWQVGSLAAIGSGSSATLDVVATVQPAGIYVATASVTGGATDPDPGNNTATVQVVPTFQADVAVDKTITSTSPLVGTGVTFTTVVSNLGPHAARSVRVRDVVPSGYELQWSMATQGAYDSATGMWAVGDLAAGGSGGSATLRIAATVLPGGVYDSTATRTASDPGDPAPNNDQATVTVTPRTGITLATAGALLGPGRTLAGTVTLLTPAPAGGVTVALAASPAGRVTLTPTAVSIAAGATTGAFTVTGVAVGDVTLTGTAAGFEPGTVGVTVTSSVISLGGSPVAVGKDLQVQGALTLGTPAPAGGLPITLTSGDPTRVQLSTTPTGPGSPQITVTVAAGATGTSDFFIQALASAGAVTVDASAPAYAPDAATITLTPSGFVIVSPAASFDTTIVSSDTAIVVAPARLDPQTLAWQQRQALRGGIAPVSVQVTATDQTGGPGVGTITSSPLLFHAGDTEQTTAFDPALLGTSLIEAAAPSPFTMPGTSRTITATVALPALTLQRAIVGPDHPAQGLLILNAPAPAGGLQVTLSSGAPGRLRLASSPTGAGQALLVITVPAGQTTASDFYLQALDTSGEVAVTAAAPGYTSAVTMMLLVPETSTLSSPLRVLRDVIGKDLQVRGSLFLGAPARAGGLPVTLRSLDPDKLRLAVNRTGPGQTQITVNIPEGRTNTDEFFIQSFAGSGEVPIMVTAPGLTSGLAWMALVPSGFVLHSPASILTTTTANPTSLLIVSARLAPDTLAWREIQELRGGVRSLAVEVTATDQSGGPGVGVITRTPLLFNGGESSKFSGFQPGAPGTSLITVVPPAGFSQPAESSIPATVVAPGVSWLAPASHPQGGDGVSYCRLDQVPHQRNIA